MIYSESEVCDITDDLLNYDQYAKMIVKFIENSADHSSLSIGINGKWGSGKSSLLNLVEIELNKKLDTYIIVPFNAWLYQGYEDARVAILERLFEVLKKNDRVKRLHKELFKKLQQLNGHPLTRGFTTIFQRRHITKGLETIINYSVLGKESSLSSNIELLLTSISEILEENNKKLILLIDDLDRCLPETAISTLTAMRLFLGLRHSAIILAGDKKILQQAVKKQFVLEEHDGHEIATDYFNKLINIEILMPQLDVEVIGQFLEQLLTQEGKHRSITHKQNFIHNIALIICRGSRIGGNPRMIKRFLNDIIQMEMLLEKDQELRSHREDGRFLIILQLFLLERLGNPIFFDKLVTINQYKNTQSNYQIINLLGIENFFIEQNMDEVDRSFIKLWIDLSSGYPREKVKEQIPQIIHFLTRQRPHRVIQRYSLRELQWHAKKCKNFPDISAIKEYKTSSFYERVHLLFALNDYYAQNAPLSDSYISKKNLLMSFHFSELKELDMLEKQGKKSNYCLFSEHLTYYEVIADLEDTPFDLLTITFIQFLDQDFFDESRDKEYLVYLIKVWQSKYRTEFAKSRGFKEIDLGVFTEGDKTELEKYLDSLQIQYDKPAVSFSE